MTRWDNRQQNAERRLRHARWDVKSDLNRLLYPIILLATLVVIGLAR